MDKRVWLATVSGVAKKIRRDLATKQQRNIKTVAWLKICKIYDWKIPWLEESGGLQSLRLQESDTT